MPREEFRVDLTADNEISDEARKAADALDEIPEKVETKIEATGVDKLLGDLDVLKQEENSAAVAAQALGERMSDLGARADFRAVVAEFERMGVSADEVSADIDRVVAKLREVDSPDLGGKLGQALGTARGETEKLADSARGANSALANMIGNSVQDLGALGGVVGSLGVGMGQMGEYAADAALGGEKLTSALLSMAGVAGPIAALAVVTKVVGDTMAAQAKSAELAAANQDRYVDAIREGGDVAENYAAALAKTGEVLVKTGQAAGPAWADILPGGSQLTGGLEMLGVFGDKLEDITRLLGKAGIDSELWSKIVTSDAPVASMDRLRASLERLNLSDEERSDILIAARSEQDNYATATENAARQTEFWGASADGAKASAEDIIDAHQRLTQAAQDQATKLAESVRQLQEYGVKVGEANNALTDLANGFVQASIKGDAMSSVFELGNAPLDLAGQVRDISLAIGDLSEAAEDVDLSEPLDPSNLKADKLLDAIDQLRPQIQTKIVEAFSSGGPEAATALASSYIDQVTAELGGRLSREEVANLLNLSSIEATIAVAVEQSAIDTARRQLEILTGVTGETPYTASIALALDAGLITGEQAQALIQTQLAGAGVEIPAALAVPTTGPAVDAATAAVAGTPVTVPTDADPSGAAAAVEDFATGAQPSTTVDILGNPQPAEEEAEGFTSEQRRTTPVDIDASTFVATAIMLAFLTARRATTIDILANALPASLTIAALVGRSYSTTVQVGTSGVGAAESAINSVARDRTVTIRPSVVPTTVLVRVDGGG